MANVKSRYTYHVFLSFRGEDTRKSFTDFLYTALNDAGFHTFRDDDEIPRGENIESELEKAINQSRISIIVFSKNYADSRWCLDELVKILRRNKASGYKVLPVFYDVKPSEVRHQTGSFKEAFRLHAEQFSQEIVNQWRGALKEVADLGGMVLQNEVNGYQSKFVMKIIQQVRNELKCNVLSFASYPVGLNSQARPINRWLEAETDDASIAVIWGMGGIGKTTIARLVYDLNVEKFEGWSFVADINKASEEPNGFIRLQKQVLFDLSKGKKQKIYSIDQGIASIKHAICNKKVLLVLDDVNNLDQLNAFLEIRDWLYQGSRIIITTRHGSLLKSPYGGYEMFRVNILNHEQSLQLFCWHAFGKDHPSEAYKDYSRSIVGHCGGLPLALEVLGSSLYRKEVDIWKSELEKLELIPNNKIIEKLKLSFDLLDHHDRNLFLDIACFFVGKSKDFVVTRLDGCDYHTTVGIDNLRDRCLLAINRNKLTMHQLLRDMGREIVHQKSPNDPGKRSRLWHQRDVFNVLRERMGTDTIEGLVLDKYMLLDQVHSLNRCGFDLKTDAFTGMRNLKILLVNHVQVIGGYQEFPKKLRWLGWQGFSLQSIPTSFQLENLVILEMRNSCLKQVFDGSKFLGSLKILDLSGSHLLIRTPDFSNLPSLEKLMLKNCYSLVEVHESIKDLKMLVFLNLEGCERLMRHQTKHGFLKSLQSLVLSSSNLSIFLPRTLRNSENEIIRSWYSALGSWAEKQASASFSLVSLPNSLVRLDLANCNLSNEDIPYDLSALSSLQHLDLSGNPIISLPASIEGLTMLKSLHLNCCRNLQSLPNFSKSLHDLYTKDCTSLERIGRLPNYAMNSMALRLPGCRDLVEIQGFFKLEPLTSIDSETIKEMELISLEESLQYTTVELVNTLSTTRRISALQGLYECGIFSIFVPGSEVPTWFKDKSTSSMISLLVPPNCELWGLNICIVYALQNNPLKFRRFKHQAIVRNKTTNLEWKYCPAFTGVPTANENMMWLSHWKFGNHELQSGNQVDILVRLDDGFSLKMCGVHFVYKKEKTVFRGSTSETMMGTIPFHGHADANPYQAYSTLIVLCHHTNFLNVRAMVRYSKWRR